MNSSIISYLYNKNYEILLKQKNTNYQQRSNIINNYWLKSGIVINT